MTAQLWNLNCRVVSWFVERLKVLDGCKFRLLYHRKTVQRKETRRPRLIEVSCGTYYLTWLVVCYRKAKLGRRCGPSYQKLGLQRRRQYQVCHHDQRCTMVNLTKNWIIRLRVYFETPASSYCSVHCRQICLVWQAILPSKTASREVGVWHDNAPPLSFQLQVAEAIF